MRIQQAKAKGISEPSVIGFSNSPPPLLGRTAAMKLGKIINYIVGHSVIFLGAAICCLPIISCIVTMLFLKKPHKTKTLLEGHEIFSYLIGISAFLSWLFIIIHGLEATFLGKYPWLLTYTAFGILWGLIAIFTSYYDLAYKIHQQSRREE